MSTKLQFACLSLSAFLTFSGAAQAGTDIILLTVAGEAYNGGPSFRVLANDKLIGVGQIPNALDTSNGSHLTDINENNVARFVFTVPSLKEIQMLDIEFYNDAWAGEGKVGDRNFYLIGLSLSMVESTSKHAQVRTVDFGPTSFKPQTPGQKGVSITEERARLASNGRLRLQRPVGGWLSHRMISSEQEKKDAVTESLPPVQKKKVIDEAAAVAGQVIVGKSKTSASNPDKMGSDTEILARLKKKKVTKAKKSASKREEKGATTASLPPAKKKKTAGDAPAAAEQLTTGKSKTSAAPAETEPENPDGETEGQPKPPNYSRYALPKEKCRRIGEKGTDRLC